MSTPSESSSRSLPLSAQFYNALQDGSEAHILPATDDSTQTLVSSTIASFRDLSKRLDSIGVFSANETLEDVSTGDLIYILVPFVFAEIMGRLRTTEAKDRVAVIREAGMRLELFLRRTEQYDIVPPDEISLFTKTGPFAVTNAVKRREVKIKQYQKEKDIRAKMNAIRARRDPKRGSEPSYNNFDLIASLLPNPDSRLGKQARTDEAGDEDDEDDVREATLLVIRLCWAQAHSQLDSLKQEMEVLRSAPPEDERSRSKTMEDDAWRLDPQRAAGGPDGRGALLDAKGKPLRPFTIVSSSKNRASMQADVFKPGHRLPTMTIDDYLAEEARRGNILTGGGAASGEKPTSAEQLAIDAEADGTEAGYEMGEKKRRKDEEWALYTEEHARGSGNTMNRG
ncbi:hypothetical protein BS47DRAFT_1286885 [Hydnum rufescens UP504]|uniref:TAP42-like protein n=1 Tax=Hydnum rufescens UP504 TaxID=1448309 RepID=A0A9P6BAI7_9AGAM|nr:hypothetical protein BS47DRAFT_1286885 [Hydnum rufescens UP504]